MGNKNVAKRRGAETAEKRRVVLMPAKPERCGCVAAGARHLCRFNVQTEWSAPFHPAHPDVPAVKRHKCRAPKTFGSFRLGDSLRPPRLCVYFPPGKAAEGWSSPRRCARHADDWKTRSVLECSSPLELCERLPISSIAPRPKRRRLPALVAQVLQKIFDEGLHFSLASSVPIRVAFAMLRFLTVLKVAAFDSEPAHKERPFDCVLQRLVLKIF